MLTDLDQFYLPNLYTFRNKNTFYGSLDELRFRVRPRVGRRTRRTPSPSAPGRGSTAWQRARFWTRPPFPWTRRATGSC